MCNLRKTREAHIGVIYLISVTAALFSFAGCERQLGADELVISPDIVDSLPATPAGRVLAAWLGTFNSGDAGQARGFDVVYGGRGPEMEDMQGFREMTGGFSLMRVEASTPDSISALLQERNSDTVARIKMSVEGNEAPKLAELSLLAIPRPADLAIARLTEADAVAALRQRAEALAAEDRWSGVLLIAWDGETLLADAYGLADRENRVPNTTETQFRLGSMNKMFTAIAILQLVEDGRLTLDDRIQDVLPDYPNDDIASKVTIRHLLTHTGGTGDIFGREFTRNRDSLREHSDYVDLYGNREPTHEAGAEHRYSNFGFVLLGRIIEEVTGMSYYEFVRMGILEPTGMTSTASEPETSQVPRRAAGYMREDGKWLSNAGTLPWRGTAAGGGYSTAGDLLRFALALEAGSLISADLLAEATRDQVDGYGFGFVPQGEDSLRNYGHGGGAPGMNGELRIYPELGYAVVALSNLDPPAASGLVDFFRNRMPISGARPLD